MPRSAGHLVARSEGVRRQALLRAFAGGAIGRQCGVLVLDVQLQEVAMGGWNGMRERNAGLAIEQVDWFVGVGRPNVACEMGEAVTQALGHLPSGLTVGEMAARLGTELGDVGGFGEVHLEQ
ncbi:MAG: hypothetical protein KatS3mg060_0856 [Dehalococcoidia bacterium]|nr:MAG: hypothetical protein KatS3mg060_0856 [Dehalococcoidia bacterium]